MLTVDFKTPGCLPRLRGAHRGLSGHRPLQRAASEPRDVGVATGTFGQRGEQVGLKGKELIYRPVWFVWLF